jgi:hypothetical protein
MAPYNTVITMLITYIVYLSIISDIVSDELKSTRVKPHTRAFILVIKKAFFLFHAIYLKKDE